MTDAGMGSPTESNTPLTRSWELPAATTPASPTVPVSPLQPGPAATPTAPAQRDQVLVHVAWEVVLLIATAVAVVVLFAAAESPLSLSLLLQQATPIGFAAMAMALSLRTGTPNLAVGAIAAVTGGIGAQLSSAGDMPVAAALTIGVVVATATGVVLGLLVAALSVPSWALTLGAAAIIDAIFIGLSEGQTIVLTGGDGLSVLWFVLFAVLSVGGGVAWLVPGVRIWLSATRQTATPGRWAGLRPGLGAVVGLAGSGFLAGLAGVALVLRLRSAAPNSASSLTIVALAAALLGGASIFGRRAGVAGTLLATLCLVAIQTTLLINGVSSWVTTIVAGVAIVIGLGVTRALESITNALTRTR